MSPVRGFDKQLDDPTPRDEAGGIDVAGLIDLQERLAANMAQPSLAGYEVLARDAIIALRAALRATPSPSPDPLCRDPKHQMRPGGYARSPFTPDGAPE